MRLRERDVRLLRDIALSHVLSRDQAISLGYFSSVTRANTKLRQLRRAGLLRALDTPFHGQHLHAATRRAASVTGERIAPLLARRSSSPRFLQHALAVTNVRMVLAARGATHWRFEQQLRANFTFGSKAYEVRPDGMALNGDELIAVEADLGHVSPVRFGERLVAYDRFVASGACAGSWHQPTFDLLVVTTGKLRARRLARLVPTGALYKATFVSFDDLGVGLPGPWS